MQNQQALVSDKGIAVLNAVAKGAHLRHEVASRLDVTIPVVNGSLNSLRRNGLVEIDDDKGTITLTGDAKPFITRSGGNRGGAVATSTPRSESKMAQARSVYDKLCSRGRAVVLATFRELGLSKGAASTYYQSIRTEALAFQAEKDKAAKKAARKAGKGTTSAAK